MKAGLTTSVIMHAALLGFGLLTLSAPKAYDVADVEALPVDIVPIEELTQIQQGDKSAPMDEKPAPTPTERPDTVLDATATGDNEVDTTVPPTPETRPQQVETAAATPPAPAPTEKPAPEDAPKAEPAPVPATEVAPVPKPKETVKPEPAPQPAEPVLPTVADRPEPAPKPVPKVEPKPVPEPVEKVAAIDPTPESKPDPIAETIATESEPTPAETGPTLPQAAPRPEARPEPETKVAEAKAAEAKAAEAKSAEATTAKTTERKNADKSAKAGSSRPKSDDKDFNTDEITPLLNKQKASGGGAKRSTDRASLGGKKSNGGAKLSQSEMDALRGQVQRCWNVPAGVEDASNLKVSVQFKLSPTGEIEGSPQIISGGGGSGIERTAAESARRAVLRCAPYNLPAEKYEAWADVIVNFDPSEMF